jgi:hypothetical protein
MGESYQWGDSGNFINNVNGIWGEMVLILMDTYGEFASMRWDMVRE